MFYKLFLSIFVFNVALVSLVEGTFQFPLLNEALDQDLYKDVIDPELCSEQLNAIRDSIFLTMFFADAGFRVPRGLFKGNTIDMGNYHQCIDFNQPIQNSEIQGKYCMIRVPIDQELYLPEWPQSQIILDNKTLNELDEFNNVRTSMLAMSGFVDNERLGPNNPLAGRTYRVAFCIPKPCTTKQVLESFLFNVSSVGFKYTDDFCRLPNDKPWVAGDTVAAVVFTLIGLLTLISTSYDLWNTIVLEKDPKTVSVIKRSFSFYTNGRRVLNFDPLPNSIDCLDGIRALAMIWVVVAHSFSSVQIWANPLDGFSWMQSWKSLWITTGNLTVDTFFMLSGFLVVYISVGKYTSNQLLKNLHLFWLNRLLRMFPLLATAVLLEATYLNRMTDGPVWEYVVRNVHRCRTTWWATLLHVQNYVNPSMTCVAQTWYLAIDVQLHILSPIILLWVLMGNRRIAWAALLTALVGVMTAATTYIFIKEFPSSMSSPGRPERVSDYAVNYYMNTLTRASPFLVGMVFGYIVKYNKLEMSKFKTTCYWLLAFSLSTFLVYVHYPSGKSDWSNQVADSLINAFVRPLWAFFVGTVIYACVNGYGGAINWFLSLRLWKLQSRLSYGMYLFHYMLMIAVNDSAVTPIYFSVKSVVFMFLGHYTLTFLVTLLLVILIDAPCSTLFKLLLGGAVRKPQKKEIEEEQPKGNEKIA